MALTALVSTTSPLHAAAQSQVPAQTAESPTPHAPVALRVALEAAWQRSVASRQAAGQSQRAVADRAITAVPWSAPPALEVSRREDRASTPGASQTELALAFPLWWPGQRDAQALRTESAVMQAAALEMAEKLRMAGQLRELAWDWAGLQADADSIQSQLRALAALAEDVERRVRAGDLARADGMAARAEWLAARAQHAEITQRLRETSARWMALTGLPNPPLTPSDPAELSKAPGAADVQVHPDVILARANLELADKALELVRQFKAEAPELSLGVRQDSSLRPSAAPHSMAIGLRVPFGPQSRHAPRLAAAQAARDIASTEEQRLQERLASERAVARQAVLVAQEQYEASRQRASLLRERAQLIERSFRAGETALPEWLRTLAAAAAAEAAMSRQRAAWGLARARLEQSLGLLP